VLTLTGVDRSPDSRSMCCESCILVTVQCCLLLFAASFACLGDISSFNPFSATIDNRLAHTFGRHENHLAQERPVATPYIIVGRFLLPMLTRSQSTAWTKFSISYTSRAMMEFATSQPLARAPNLSLSSLTPAIRNTALGTGQK
jgi:hypothetical protein